jgi:nucleoid-associated protein YgaU
MTSDAKIGLLLGLVFIFAIAFVINGLPRFRTAPDNNELTADMVNSQNGTPGIAARERKAQELFNWEQRVTEYPAQEDETALESNDEGVRFEMPLPEEIAPVIGFSVEETANEFVPASPSPLEPIIPAPITVQTVEVKAPEPIRPAAPRTYIVVEGDNLGDIAKKVYGTEEGNKQVNVTRIFQANSTLLKSPDEVYIGQKLVIPALPASAPDKDKSTSSFPGALFEKVKSIGRKRVPDSEKATAGAQYVVKDGDNLWTIAAEQLGSGVRYKEIADLNADALSNDDTLAIGMRLRMPAQ